MKLEQLRELGPEALTALEREQRERIFKLRFQHAMGQLDSPASSRTAKRDLARTLTVAGEKRGAEKQNAEKQNAEKRNAEKRNEDKA